MGVKGITSSAAPRARARFGGGAAGRKPSTSMLALAVISASLAWVNPAATTTAHAVVRPPGRLLPAMASDPATGNLVMFGGLGNIDPQTGSRPTLGDTWVWNGLTWRQVHPPASPSARTAAAMAADPATGTVVLFGDDSIGETWTWDGRTETWTMNVTAGTPGPRRGASMATDKSTGTVVLFGGATSGQARNDTWVWNGGQKTWTLRVPLASPPARLGANMAADPATGALVLFGGQVFDGGPLLGDTWTWKDGAWTGQQPARSPVARKFAYMASHPPTRKVVLFGGMDGGSPGVRNDTWSWDGTVRNWTKQAPQNRPCPRAQGVMAYHLGSGQSVIAGGQAQAPCPNTTLPLVKDTWAWTGTNWKEKG